MFAVIEVGQRKGEENEALKDSIISDLDFQVHNNCVWSSWLYREWRPYDGSLEIHLELGSSRLTKLSQKRAKPRRAVHGGSSQGRSPREASKTSKTLKERLICIERSLTRLGSHRPKLPLAKSRC